MTKGDIRRAFDVLIAGAEVRLKAAEEDLKTLVALRAEMHNRAPQTRGKKLSQPITPELRQQILDYHKRNPTEPQHQIGAVFHVQQGRVSEILAGKRT